MGSSGCRAGREGTGDRTRTCTSSRTVAPKATASASSATPAKSRAASLRASGNSRSACKSCGSGERAGARTQNLGIKSPLLYQLSYAPGRKLGRGLFPGKIAPASAAGRLDAQAITRCERERGMARDGLDAAVGTLDRVATPRARAAAGEAPGREAPALAEQRDRQRCER